MKIQTQTPSAFSPRPSTLAPTLDRAERTETFEAGSSYAKPAAVGFVAGLLGVAAGSKVGLTAPPLELLRQAGLQMAQNGALMAIPTALTAATAMHRHGASDQASVTEGLKCGLVAGARFSAVQAAGCLAAQGTLLLGARLLANGNGLGMLATAALTAGLAGAAANVACEAASRRHG